MKTEIQNHTYRTSAVAEKAAAEVTAELRRISRRGKDAATRFAYTGEECVFVQSAIHSILCALFQYRDEIDGERKALLRRIDLLESRTAGLTPARQSKAATYTSSALRH